MTDRLTSGETYVCDFDPMCKCGNHAVHFLEIHAVDYCTELRPTWISLLCPACLGRDIARAAKVLSHGEVWCSTCGTTLVTLSDIIVTVSPLIERGRDA